MNVLVHIQRLTPAITSRKGIALRPDLDYTDELRESSLLVAP